jgi:DNA-binding transcriptional LysR family regulator
MAERLLVDGLYEALGGVEIEILTSNDPVDLAKREADLALRLVRPHDPALVIRRVATFSYAVYASREYVARRGAPEGGELRGHSLVLGTRELGASPEWTCTDWVAQGVHVALRTNGLTPLRSAIEAGIGVGVLPQVTGESRASLVRVAELPGAPKRHAYLVRHRDANSPNIQRVATAVAAVMKRRSVPDPYSGAQ